MSHRRFARTTALRSFLLSFGAALAVVLGGAFAAVPASAQEGGGCVYDRRIYPEGTEMCQGSQRVRCEEGAWADIGMCDGDEPGPEPITGGGDVEMR